MLNKILHTKVYSNFIHLLPKLEVTVILFKRWVDNQAVVHPYIGILLSNKKKRAIKSWKDKSEYYIQLAKWKKPVWNVATYSSNLFLSLPTLVFILKISIIVMILVGVK
jgi:hypothetical protein